MNINIPIYLAVSHDMCSDATYISIVSMREDDDDIECVRNRVARNVAEQIMRDAYPDQPYDSHLGDSVSSYISRKSQDIDVQLTIIDDNGAIRIG